MQRPILIALAAMFFSSAAMAQSEVLKREDLATGDSPSCKIAFAYEGKKAETLIWDEPCDAVSATIVDEARLKEFGAWQDLGPFDRDFIQAMPDGQVLYVEGSFSASLFPIGSTGETYELSVSD